MADPDPKQIASQLQGMIQSIEPGETSQVELEKLRAGLTLVLERAKLDIAAGSEGGRTGLELVRAVTPLLITGILGGLASIVTLVFQAKQHDRDLAAQQSQAKIAADRESQDL